MKKNVLLGLMLPALLATTLLFGLIALAGEHELWDEAHFFKPETLDRVEESLRDVRARFGKDLMIETFASIPDDLKPTFQRDGKVKFFEKWTTVEASDLHVDGVMILICGQPSYIQVDVGSETQKKAFTLDDRDELVEILSSAFKKHEFDAGIVNAAFFIQNRIARNLGGGPAATQPAGMQSGGLPPGDLKVEVEAPTPPPK